MEDEDETSTTSGAETDEDDEDEFVNIFTKQEEIMLLERIKEIKQSICNCKSCTINKMTDIVYQITKKRKLRPKSVRKTLKWDENWQLDSEWQNTFEQRHKDLISKLPLNCATLSTPQVPTRKFLYIPPEILTFDGEQFYLIYLQEIQILHNCMCRRCIISMVSLQAYLLARDLKKDYPKSWDIDKTAGYEWIRKFILKGIHKIILKYSRKCKWPMSIHQSFNVTSNIKQAEWKVFLESEELLLLTRLQEIGEHCKCKNCLMKEVSFSIYIMAQDLERKYPRVWDRDKQPSLQWMAQFEERHKDEISKLSPACATFQSLWTRLRTGAIFTYERERLLLTQVQERETQCCCKKCLLEKISIVAYTKANKSKKWYPKWWDIDERAGKLWMEGFQERHEDRISKYSSVCKVKIPQALRKREIYVGRFTYDEGQMLLTLLQEMETVHGCKCKNCLRKELLNLAYVMAYELNIAYPKSWDRDKQAEYNWLQRFERKHNEISEFPTTCKIFETSTTKQLIRGVLTDDNEKTLLIMIKDMEFHYGCNCKMCFIKVLSILVYKIARELKKCYPIWWDIHKQAGIWWKQKFAKRHEDEISKLSSACKRQMFMHY